MQGKRGHGITRIEEEAMEEGRPLRQIRRRVYTMEVMQNGAGFMNWPGQVVQSDARIRQTCVEVFRRWFGWYPSRHWHQDGVMAQAWDKRGNRITMEQVNCDQMEIIAAGADIICGREVRHAA